MESINAREKWIYGVGSLSKDLIQGMFIVYLMVYYTDVFGIGAAAAGILLMVARIWDAILNPIIGSAIDRTRTKWGRCRPYIFAMPIPFTIFAVLTFTDPGLSGGAKLIYAYITYILAGTCFTFYDVSFWALLPSLTSNLKDRGAMIGLARIFTVAGIMAVATFAMPIIGKLGGGNISKGYSLFVLILAVISIIIAWLIFFNTKERVIVSAEPPKLKENLKVIMNNKPLLAVVIGVIINNFNLGINSAVGIYHLIYSLKVPQLISVYMLVTNISSIVGMALSSNAIKKFGNKKVSIYSLILSAIFMSLIFIVPTNNITLMFIVIAISSFFGGIPLVSITGMVAETVDYTEFKTGVRADGLIFSFNSFSTQVGMAIASGVAGIILQHAGYIPNSMEQTSTAITWINLMRSLIPAAICLLAVLIIRLYPISKNDYEEITINLKVKREAEAN